MSFKPAAILPANPNTARGEATKLSSNQHRVVYANGKSIIIRDLNNPGLSVTYSGHVQNTTVARFSPSGYYCASGDITGTVRVWDTVGEDQSLKGEYKVISGRINDLDWDGESKRIIAVGDGREKFGHAFMMDSGSSTGEIIGHSKVINAVAIRHQRPYRAATAADDASIVFHQGAPYKYDRTIKEHTKFIQDVRYALSGDHFASVGSDAKAFIYDGKTGDTLGELSENSHKGTIMACSWSPDSKSLVTSSADCTVKLWDVETRKPTVTWTVGSGVNHQQVGNTWSGEKDIVSLSLSSDLNVFDPRVGDKPTRIIMGAQKAITAITNFTRTSDTFLTGSADGRVLSHNVATSESTTVPGSSHTSLVSSMTTSPVDGSAFSVAFDDQVREISGKGFTPSVVSAAAQPKAVAAAEDSSVFVAEIGRVEVVRSNQKVSELACSFNPSSIAVYENLVAVGGEDNKVHLFDWDGKALKAQSVLEGNKGVVSSLAFAPNGIHLAAGDSSGRIALYDVAKKSLVTSRWSFHSARVNSLSWTADSAHCASGSLDTAVYVWSVAKPLKNIALKNVGPGGVNGVLWVGSNKLVSAGADGCARLWDITFHA
ncbi:WD40-repeat-containing domain protein [Mycena floridula]|nr:WD40-repeat-containing domain protein [Mycena floridula]